MTNTRLLLSTVRGPAQAWFGRANAGRLAKRREDAVGPVLGARGALARRLDSTILATVPGMSDVGLLTRTPAAVLSVSTVGAVTVVRCTVPEPRLADVRCTVPEPRLTDVRCTLPAPTVTTDWRLGPAVVVTTGADKDGVVVVVSAVAGTSTRLSPICTTKNCLGTVALLWVVEAKPGATGTWVTTAGALGRPDPERAEISTGFTLVFVVDAIDVVEMGTCPALIRDFEMAWASEALVASFRDGEEVVVTVAALASKDGMIILEGPLLVAAREGMVMIWGKDDAPLAGMAGMVIKRGPVVAAVWPDDG